MDKRNNKFFSVMMETDIEKKKEEMIEEKLTQA